MKFSEIKIGKVKFPWGKPIEYLEIGEYQFIKYFEDEFKMGVATGKISENIWYSIFIGGNSIGQSAETLEGAMLAAMAYKFEGSNSRIPEYVIRMLGDKHSKVYLEKHTKK